VKRKLLLAALAWVAVASVAAPVFAQEGGGAWTSDVYKWAVIAGAGALAIGAAFGALSQGRAIAAACDGIARNPSASPQIRFALIFGLVLIESLVIYVLLISLVIFFVKWGTA